MVKKLKSISRMLNRGLRGFHGFHPPVMGTSRSTIRPSDFGLLSDLGLRISAFLLLAFLALSASGQSRPYIGFVYPAGGQQGTTFRIRLGGQALDDVQSVLITGTGVTANVAECYRRLNNQELDLLNEQVKVLKRAISNSSRALPSFPESAMMMPQISPQISMMLSLLATTNTPTASSGIQASTNMQALVSRIEARTSEFVQNPASASLASLVIVEVTVAPDAEPGEREIRLVTLRGVSNPMTFHIGQLPEVTKQPMHTATQQVLGKEAQALRKWVPGDDEASITLPCTVNGQIASGEVNRYHFTARRGQRLVINALGRQLVPFLADAVPGWFQPVLAVYDAGGKEMAYCDDYRFNPDPTIFYEVPSNGEYSFTIRDSIYRGREDFVYRITIGELPFITSIFPLGAQAERIKPKVKGWNLEGAELAPAANAGPGVLSLAVVRKGLVSNRVPFAQDTLPEVFELEPNNTPTAAQRVTLPVIINGRINQPDDWDVFQFSGTSNEVIVAEVTARRLDSPLDSVLKLTDAAGNVLTFNDDHEDIGYGLNTHLADSYLMAKLPADGQYFVHIGDTTRQGGDEYGYRLRLSEPQPDFELRVVPSSLALRVKSAGTLTVYAQRKDGFDGPIKLALKDPPAGFSAPPVTLLATQAVARLNIRTTLASNQEPVRLTIAGSARLDNSELSREAVPAEDRMQAFLWRHLVPARDLDVLVFDPAYQPPPKRIAPPLPPSLLATNSPIPNLSNTLIAAAITLRTNTIGQTNTIVGTNAVPAKPKFTKQQVTARLRQLKVLYEEGMLTDEFYEEKVAECQVVE